MSPYDSPSSMFFGLTEQLEPMMPDMGPLPFGQTLPPFLFDMNPESSGRRAELALAWASEAQQIIAAQNERIAYLETLTMTDEMTGLLNRRGFFSHFRRELAHASRNPADGGVVAMVDLDGFKAINDTLGHEAGDAVLVRVAKLLGEQVRGQDVVARLGGDEFAILLTSVDPVRGSERVTVLARRLNTATLNSHGRVLPIRLSVGSAPYGANDREDLVMRRADTAMYANKTERHPGRRAHH